jgi:large subunit ribosomal protein L3
MANQQPGLIGTKIGMTQLYGADGQIVPVTVVEITPNTVLAVKTESSKDGYNALQLGVGAKKPIRATQPELGHAKKAGLEHAPKVVREIRVTPADLANATLGQKLDVSLFKEGELVDVTGTSKGRGFAGVFKRHHFSGFVDGHGTHEYFRHGGSIGTRLTPGMTLKGKKMPGHLGDARVTVQNIKVARVDAERGLLFIQGGCPGPDGATVVVRKAVKRSTKKAAAR